jgi:hypothetical protein
LAARLDVTISTGWGTARSIRWVAVDMSVDDLHTLLGQSRLGVLATIKTDGRPQLSPVMPYYDRAAGVIYVSTAEGLAKTANLRRIPARRWRSPAWTGGPGQRQRAPRK